MILANNAPEEEAIRRETPRRAPPPLGVFRAAVAAVENPTAHISELIHHCMTEPWHVSMGELNFSVLGQEVRAVEN